MHHHPASIIGIKMQQISKKLGFSQAHDANIMFYQLCQITTHVSGKHQGVV
jgi:hypothetical protein